MKKILILVVASTAVFALRAQNILTLEDAVAEALQNNYDIQVAQNNVNRSNIEHHIGNADMLPNISTSASYSASNGSVTQEAFTGQTNSIDNAQNNNAALRLNVDQTIFDGFRMFRVFDKLGKATEFTNLKLQEEIENMTSQVVTAYYDVVGAYEYQELIKQSLKVSNEQFTIVKRSQELGKASLIDVLNVEVTLAQDSSNLLKAKNSKEQAVNYLSFLLGGKDLSTFKFINDVSINRELLNELSVLTTANNVLLKQAVVNMEITELDYQIYKSSMLPQVFASLGYNINQSESDFGFANSTNSNTFSYGLTASWSLFQGFKRNIQLKTAQIEQLNQKISFDKVSQNLSSDLNNAKTAFKGALANIDLQERNLSLFEKQYEVTKHMYDVGKRTMLELTQAQQQLFNAKNNLFSARKDAKTQEIQLLRLSGKLIK